MSITYVTIGGASCDTYRDSLPSETSIVLVNGTSVLNSQKYVAATGYGTDTVGTLRNVNFTNYKFDLTTDRTIILNTTANRYLSPTGITPVDTTTVNKRILAPSSGSSYTYNSTVYTRNTTAVSVQSTIRNLMSSSVPCISGYSGSVPNFTNSAYTAGSTQISPLLGLSGSTSITYYNTPTSTSSVTNVPLFFLRKLSSIADLTNGITSNIYYKNDGNFTDLQTLSDIASQINNNSYKFFVARYTENQGTETENILIRCYSITGGNPLTFYWDETNRVFRESDSGNILALDGTNPQDDIGSGQNTLIKTNTNQYLYWTGYNSITPSSSSTTFATRDYWSSGGTTSTNELGYRTIFNWIDLTATATGSFNDVYHWKFLNPSNYYFYLSGTTATFSTTVPPMNEGWAILYDSTASNTIGFLVYVRAGSIIGYFDQTGTLVISGSGLPLAQSSAHASLPATSKIYKCARCSGPLGNDGLCPA